MANIQKPLLTSWRKLLYAFLLNILCADSFIPQRVLFGPRQTCVALASSSPDEENSENDPVDDMRRLLESSWNSATMGVVPTKADSAASAAAESLLLAMEQRPKSAFLINILLPQYDIAQGSNLYDEVLAVEFCMALACRLEGKSAIVVRDDKTVQTVNRILDVRERVSGIVVDEEEEDEDVEFYDDFADVDSIGDSGDHIESRGNVSSFREKLVSTWEHPAAEINVPEPGESEVEADFSPKRYRLTSMLGDTTKLASGADMQSGVIKAVSANAQPKEDEDILIILSAASPEEMIGVRGLVRKFGNKKTIIMVNCKFDPLPRELTNAKPVYSILPLIARTAVSETNLFGSEPKEEPKAPKIVVLRRYPRGWEVYVDTGSGFKLVASAPAAKVGRKGPSMQWIAGCVKQHLQSR